MKIALCGNIGSGKSTVASELSQKDYYLLSYTELIKNEVARAMTATQVTASEKEALEKIHTQKEFYRPLLVAWADTCGWSDGKQLTKILPTLSAENIVMDNIRFLAQAHIVKQNGFLIFKLSGGDRMDIPELADFPFDAVIPWMENVEERIQYILDYLKKLGK